MCTLGTSRIPAGRLPILLGLVTIMMVVALTSTAAWAGVEFVTPVGKCHQRVDRIGDGKDLFIMAGENVQFEVWGNSVDLTDPRRGLRIATDSGRANVRARIVERHSGASNARRKDRTRRNCPFTGSAVVEIDSPANLNRMVQRSIFFKMPLGDESRLQISIKPFPPFQATWSSPRGGGNLQCIVGNGSRVVQSQNTAQIITLPPGHRQDRSNCIDSELWVDIRPANIGEVDIAPRFSYTMTGVPNFLTARTTNQAAHFPLNNGGAVKFTINPRQIRRLTARSNSTITIRNPRRPARRDSLRLVVQPELGNGFRAVAACTPTRFNVGDPTDCLIRLAARAGGAGQPITWRMTTATCFAQAVATAPYNPGATFQVFRLPGGRTSANIRTRSINGNRCGDADGVTHIFEAWVGDFRTNPQVTAVTSGPTYTRANIRVVQPPRR